jgi:predicted porin
MNKKLIALAVGGVVSAPVAYADITAYGRINNAIDFSDGDTDISTVSSRFGFKGSGDIGNGLTAFGRYEFSTGTDRELPAVGDIRLAFVGLSGGFGSVSIGNQWSAFFNSVGTIVSPTFSLGAGSATPFRASNTIKYANSFGPVSLDVDVRLNDSDEDGDVAEGLNGNGYGIGLTINPTDFFTLALAIDSEEDIDEAGNDLDDTDRAGIAATFSFGGFGINVGYQNQEQGDEEIDTTNLYLSYEIGKSKILVGFGNIDDGGGEDNEGNFIGLYHNLGGGLRLWLESVDSDGLDDRITVLGARIDF